VPRAVLDTNVLVSALITPEGASAQLLSELRAGAFEIVVSALLLTELGEVLSRPKFQRFVSAPEIDAYLDLLRREGTVGNDPEPSAQPLVVDPDDQYLIDLARESRVDALVSGDAHLLELRGAIPVMSPREFLDSLARAGP